MDWVAADLNGMSIAKLEERKPGKRNGEKEAAAQDKIACCGESPRPLHKT